ncbi:hypothetical protein PTTG_25694, partial [Puccinia triticina 1-1 BBBD Race 1]
QLEELQALQGPVPPEYAHLVTGEWGETIHGHQNDELDSDFLIASHEQEQENQRSQSGVPPGSGYAHDYHEHPHEEINRHRPTAIQPTPPGYPQARPSWHPQPGPHDYSPQLYPVDATSGQYYPQEYQSMGEWSGGFQPIQRGGPHLQQSQSNSLQEYQEMLPQFLFVCVIFFCYYFFRW